MVLLIDFYWVEILIFFAICLGKKFQIWYHANGPERNILSNNSLMLCFEDSFLASIAINISVFGNLSWKHYTHVWLKLAGMSFDLRENQLPCIFYIYNSFSKVFKLNRMKDVAILIRKITQSVIPYRCCQSFNDCRSLKKLTKPCISKSW